jgi:sulfite exporter TauE/SafE
MLSLGLEPQAIGLLSGLASAVLLMGVAGVPHCAAMCAAPCAVAMPAGVGCRALLARTVGYAALGAVAAGLTSWLGRWSAVAAVLQPLWLMALFASVLFGAWLLWRGEMPLQVQAHGQRVYRWLQQRVGGHMALRWAWLLGIFWAALPCGLLYGAVGVAALAPQAWQGAMLMAVFSVPGALAIGLAPRVLARLAPAGAQVSAGEGQGVAPVLWVRAPELLRPTATPRPPASSGAQGRWWAWRDARVALRLAGLSLVMGCGWALSHRLWAQWQAWCA